MNKYEYEQRNIIYKFLLIGEKFMPEIHLWDHKVKKYSACGPFIRHQQRIDQFMTDERLSHIAKNKLDATCFRQDSAYNKYKDSVNRKQSNIVLRNKAFKIATDPKINGYQRGLAAMVYKFFIRTKGSGIENKPLAEELHKPIIRNFKRRKVYSSFKYLLCVIDLFSRYAWVIGLKNKKKMVVLLKDLKKYLIVLIENQ